MNHPSLAIETARLSKSFGDRIVLRGIDLKIEVGSCVALTGPNGSGKTTLLRCLAAMTRPTDGEVRWFGRRATTDPDQRRLIGMVSHENRLYAHLTLRENLLFSARMWGLKEPARRVVILLKELGLGPLAERQVRQISKGMRQRLSIARALIHKPPILLLDEPFSGLDSTSQDWLSGLLHKLRANSCAICFTTHDETHTRQFADRSLVLHEGSMAEMNRRQEAGRHQRNALQQLENYSLP